MKIHDILREASDDSGDYQQMLAFTRANRVGGVPDAQQIPLALFKELKKQQQQNQALGRELSAAERRIDQAMQSGELSKQELGMHRGELDRERAAGDQQRAAVTQLGQQYSERERASTEQIKQLAGQLEQVKAMPGVNKSAAEALEKQIKELGERSVPVARLAELESSIAAVQSMQSVDDQEIKSLMAQIDQAQKATQEFEKTRASVGKDAEKTAAAALDQVEQLKQDIERLQQVEKTVSALQPLVKSVLVPKVDRLTQDKAIRDKIALKQSAKGFAQAMQTGALPSGTPTQMMPAEPDPQASLPGFGDPANEPGYQQSLPLRAVAESQFLKHVRWATGKRS
jgi:DNA repair exonuclease SbcCD ATPase subunit